MPGLDALPLTSPAAPLVKRLAPFLPHTRLPRVRRRRDRRPRGATRRVPLAKLPVADFYCKTIWPGGLVGVPVGAAPPPGPWWKKIGTGIGAGRGTESTDCYPNNLASVPDIANNGTYGQAMRADLFGALVTERTQQRLATIDRAEAAGRLAEKEAAFQRAEALQRAAISPNVAARAYDPDARLRALGTGSKTGPRDPLTVTDAELEGVCGHPAGVSQWYCRMTWPGGFLGADKDGNPPPNGPWLAVPSYGAHEGCYPFGKPWWLRTAAWLTREVIAGGEDVRQTIETVGKLVARFALEVSAQTVQEVTRTTERAARAAGTEVKCNIYVKKSWPGGYGCIPEGVEPPSAEWVRQP